jgi:hypothetical protein
MLVRIATVPAISLHAYALSPLGILINDTFFPFFSMTALRTGLEIG